MHTHTATHCSAQLTWVGVGPERVLHAHAKAGTHRRCARAQHLLAKPRGGPMVLVVIVVGAGLPLQLARVAQGKEALLLRLPRGRPKAEGGQRLEQRERLLADRVPCLIAACMCVRPCDWVCDMCVLDIESSCFPVAFYAS